MAANKTAVRQVLDKTKAEGRTALTAPEGKLVCEAYGIPVPKEGVAASAADAAKLAAGMGFPVVLKIVSPGSCTRPKPAACWSASGARRKLKRATTRSSPTRSAIT